MLLRWVYTGLCLLTLLGYVLFLVVALAVCLRLIVYVLILYHPLMMETEQVSGPSNFGS